MLSIANKPFMLSVVMLNVIMLNVVAPEIKLEFSTTIKLAWHITNVC
jgi:hypothetical protein